MRVSIKHVARSLASPMHPRIATTISHWRSHRAEWFAMCVVDGVRSHAQRIETMTRHVKRNWSRNHCIWEEALQAIQHLSLSLGISHGLKSRGLRLHEIQEEHIATGDEGVHVAHARQIAPLSVTTFRKDIPCVAHLGFPPRFSPLSHDLCVVCHRDVCVLQRMLLHSRQLRVEKLLV